MTQSLSQSTAGHGRVMNNWTKAGAATGGTEKDAIPAELDAKPGGSTCRLQDEFEPWSDDKASGSPTATSKLANNSKIQDRLATATTPRVSGDLTADPCQQRLALTQQLKQQRRGKKSQGYVWPKADTKNCKRSPRGASASTSGWLWNVSYDGPTMREDDEVDSALVEFVNHRQFRLGMQAWEGESLPLLIGRWRRILTKYGKFSHFD